MAKSESRDEPNHLSAGKQFHKELQADWKQWPHDGTIHEEHSVTKPSLRKGRIDIRVEVDGSFVSVVELKNTNWDKLKHTSVRPTIRRYIRQMWDYIESQLDREVDISPDVVARKIPDDPDRIARRDHMVQLKWLYQAKQKQVIWVNLEEDMGKEIYPGVFLLQEPEDPSIAEKVRRSYKERGVRVVWRSDFELDVAPGIIFNRRPDDENRLAMIEELFEQNGISVIWHEDVLAERNEQERR